MAACLAQLQLLLNHSRFFQIWVKLVVFYNSPTSQYADSGLNGPESTPVEIQTSLNYFASKIHLSLKPTDVKKAVVA